MQTEAAPPTRGQRRRLGGKEAYSDRGLARQRAKEAEEYREPMHEIIRRWRKTGTPVMTLLDLAYAIECSLTTVSRWEAGKGRLPKLKNVRAMEEVKPGLVRMLFPKAFR